MASGVSRDKQLPVVSSWSRAHVLMGAKSLQVPAALHGRGFGLPGLSPPSRRSHKIAPTSGQHLASQPPPPPVVLSTKKHQCLQGHTEVSELSC